MVQKSKGAPSLLALERLGMFGPSMRRKRGGSKKLVTTGGTSRSLVGLRPVSFQTDGLVELTPAFFALVTFPTLLGG